MKAGARECLKLLWRYQRAYGAGNVALRQSRIAAELQRPLRSVQRWLGHLSAISLVEIRHCGPGAAEYFVKENGGALAELWRSKGRGISITEYKENKPVNGRTARLISDLESYFGESTIGGKKADQRLLREIAALLTTDEAVTVWRYQVKRFGKMPSSWGFFLYLAREIAGPAKKPQGLQQASATVAALARGQKL